MIILNVNKYWCLFYYIQFDVPEEIQREDVIKTHRSEGYGFANNFIYSLCILQGLLKQYEKWGNLLNKSSNEFHVQCFCFDFQFAVS